MPRREPCACGPVRSRCKDGEIVTSALTFGGNINLEVANLFYALDSDITASAGGSGGNITIKPPQFVVLDGSPITAFGGVSNGNIIISPEFFLTQASPVTATGIVTITAPDLNLSNSLLPLPDALISDENQLKETCARTVNREIQQPDRGGAGRDGVGGRMSCSRILGFRDLEDGFGRRPGARPPPMPLQKRLLAGAGLTILLAPMKIVLIHYSTWPEVGAGWRTWCATRRTCWWRRGTR